jgi:hypothetical protein
MLIDKGVDVRNWAVREMLSQMVKDGQVKKPRAWAVRAPRTTYRTCLTTLTP